MGGGGGEQWVRVLVQTVSSSLYTLSSQGRHWVCPACHFISNASKKQGIGKALNKYYINKINLRMSELNLNPRQQNHLEICCILIPTNIRLMSLLPEPQGETWVVRRSSWGPSSQSGQQGPPRTLQHLQGSSGVDFCFKFLKNRSEIWFTCHCRDISLMTRSWLLPSVHPQGKITKG